MQSNECEGDEVTRDQAVATWGEPSVAGVDERAEEHVAEWWPTPYEEDCARGWHDWLPSGECAFCDARRTP